MDGAIVDRTPGSSSPDYHPRPPQPEGAEEEQSWESVITLPRLPEWYEDEDDGLDEDKDFLERWDNLEDLLERRRKHLERVLSKKRRLLNSSFQRQIRDRENQVANRKRLQLLEKEAKRVDRVEINERLKKAGWTVDESSMKLTNHKPWRQRWLDWLIYEVNMFLPALGGLFLHSVLMGGFFEIVQCMFQKVYSFTTLELQSDTAATRLIVIVQLLMIGIVALRYTGYLYWWLNDRDYDCLKFDYHNRLRLGDRDAQRIHRVRSHWLVRMIVYMLSYNLIFLMVNEIYYILPYVWGEHMSQRLTDLPSATSSLDHALSTDGFACLLPCHQEMERRDAIDEMLLAADFEYTQEVLSWNSHVRYWLSYVYRHDFVSSSKSEQIAKTWVGDLLHLTLIISVCVALMRWYGFVFWITY
jgi:hypothetical protein